MDIRSRRTCCIPLAVVAAVALGRGLPAQVVVPPDLGVPPNLGTRPSPAYDAAFVALAQGGFSAGLELAMEEYRSSTRVGAQRWIDSIASAAVVGECHYERGDFGRAVAAYDEAMAIAAEHPDWPLGLQFPAQPPRAAPGGRGAGWIRSRRGTVPAMLPAEIAIRIQGANPQQVLERGGVLAAPFDRLIRPQEIMRALVIAVYRRTEILGELGRETPTLDAVARVLARRPAPANHYSQSWIDVALGTALWAQGKPDQAAPLLARGLTVAPGLDHGLTPWGLIVLGRIALDADRAAEALRQFEEAAAAAAACGDARAIEESLRLAVEAHALTGDRGVPDAVRAAGNAISPRDGLDVLRARLVAMQAEALAAAGDARAAVAALREIDQRFLRGDPGRAAVGAEVAYAAALANFAAGELDAGDADLGRALQLARGRSTRLFQTATLVRLVGESSSIPDRRAEALFARLLGSPPARDFAADPLGTLAVITTARAEAFDAWIAVAARRGFERANDAVLDPAEAARRDRWLTARPLGGRRISAARLLAADPATLDPATAARRAAVVATRPDIGPTIERLQTRRAALAEAAVAAGADAAAAPRAPPGAAEDWTAYRDLAATLSKHTAMLAAGRAPVTIDVPPLAPATEIRRGLGDRQLVLSFHWTARGLSAALESRDRFVVWDVRQAAGLQAAIAELARGLALFDGQAPVGTDRLLASDWHGPAGRIERMLFENSRVSLAEGIDELVIVPEGWLWYVPFELLPVSSARPDAADRGPRPLGELCRIRYCPTRSLAVSSPAGPPRFGPIGIHAGRMVRGDDAATAAAVLARTTGSIPRAVPVQMPAAGPPGPLVAAVFDALAVFDESRASAAIVPPATGRGSISFADWLAPPAKRPRIVLLPGLGTAMGEGLDPQSLPPRPGDDLFLPATDLLVAGADTAVISRWRVGGGTCVDLMTEFLREATAPVEQPESATRLWRRAVDLVTAECPDVAREPRLRQKGAGVLADARHPFLWAGYMLVDRGRQAAPPVKPAPAREAAR